MGLACSGFQVLVHATTMGPLGDGSLNTLLGFETASPSPLRPECGEPGVIVSSPAGGGRVVAPSWWWGVVFDLWIVVASI